MCASLVFLSQMWLHARMCSWIKIMIRARVRVGPRVKVRVVGLRFRLGLV